MPSGLLGMWGCGVVYSPYGTDDVALPWSGRKIAGGEMTDNRGSQVEVRQFVSQPCVATAEIAR